MKQRSLVETIKSIIERSYGIPPVIDDLGSFIVGDAGYRLFYGSEITRSGPGARTLVRQSRSGVRASLYYPDALVRHLERHNPLDGLGDVNIDGFAVLVEELDHLLTVAHRALQGRPISLLELEHHAGVTKYLMVLHFLGKQTGHRRVTEALRAWARHHLFERYSSGPGEGEERYRAAARLARRHIAYLETLSVDARRAELRAFQRRPFADTRQILARIN
ncbi:MAG: hypothetical protein HY510_01640 [Acidobacteria bacterium]|nr:hypothetical protein [Acidobacteriota bacterium]